MINKLQTLQSRIEWHEFYFIFYLAFTKQSDTVWLTQKFCMISGVPLSMKFEPNLIFRTLQALNSFRLRALFPPWHSTIFSSKVSSTLREEVFTIGANVRTRTLVIPATSVIKGNVENPGRAISPCILIHTNIADIWIAGVMDIITGTIVSVT